MDLSMAIIAFYFLSGMLGIILFRAGALRGGIDSPSLGHRYFSRFFIYWTCNLLSCFVSPAAYRAFFDFEGKKSTMPELVLLLGPLPLAVLFYLGMMWMLRAGNRRERSLRRKLGLLSPLAPAPAPPEVRSRATGFASLDMNDPEIVRELARRHWQEINHALASDGDVSHADNAQRQFLDKYVPTLEPELAARVNDLYLQESEVHLKEFARLSGNKRDRMLERAQLRRRMGRNAVILAAIAFGLVVLTRLVESFG